MYIYIEEFKQGIIPNKQGIIYMYICVWVCLYKTRNWLT